mmetsp:Transcript_94055/g.205968  ORF Transcript_94055/g.205968 Transcript_94055/m.205968 type:complete len:236 (+) Transcript_94055:2379-3086(+)
MLLRDRTKSLPTSCVSMTPLLPLPLSVPEASCVKGILSDINAVQADIVTADPSSPMICFIHNWQTFSATNTRNRSITLKMERFSTVLMTSRSTSGLIAAANDPWTTEVTTATIKRHFISCQRILMTEGSPEAFSFCHNSEARIDSFSVVSLSSSSGMSSCSSGRSSPALTSFQTHKANHFDTQPGAAACLGSSVSSTNADILFFCYMLLLLLLLLMLLFLLLGSLVVLLLLLLDC